MRSIILLVTLLVNTLFVFAGNNQSMRNNAKSGIAKELPDIHPIYSAYHVNDSITRIYFSVKSNELLYMRHSKDINEFVSKGKVTFMLYSSYASTLLIDSASFIFTDTLKKDVGSTDYINGYFNVKTQNGNFRIAEVSMFDLNRKVDALAYLEIDKKSKLSRQNFFVRHINDSALISKNYVVNDDTVVVKYNKSSNHKLFVKYYLGEFLLPSPPFSYQERKSFNYSPDSVFEVDLNANNEAFFTFKRKGIYHIVEDSSQMEGLTIMRFEHNIPQLNNELDMLKSIRFITTKQEYDELISSDNLKLSLDKYWLKCSQNNKDKAKVLIRNYYTRIEKANNYFTSFDEGWRTDRGLVFLIFGPPQVVNRDAFSETWVYGDESNAMRQVKFIYTKVENPFTSNDYILNRSESYKEIWYRNVDAWRMGRVLNDK